MIARTLAAALKQLSTQFPVLLITGPRQSGKTTLAKSLFNHLPYVLLEEVEVRIRAQQDPRAFLAQYIETGAIFDEIQNVPELASYLQGIVDASNKTGRFVLTGSQNFTLTNTVTQSLAGRVGVTTLLPFSLTELGFVPDPLESIFKGGYPRLHKAQIGTIPFYSSYLSTYIERDIRALQNIQNLAQFQTFLKLCAGRVGQVVNFSSLAADCGLSHVTAREWLSLLEASYIVFRLPPFFKNYSKRLIKMPKLYFYDTGLACFLLGISDKSALDAHYLKGGLFENLVILEVMKKRLAQVQLPNLYFWRDQTGHEIDLVGDWDGVVHAVEIKFAMTFQPEYTKTLDYFLALDPTAKAYLVYNGILDGPFKSVELVPLRKLSVALL